MAGYGKSAALLGTTIRERGHHEVAPRSDRRRGTTCVQALVGGVGEEVKGRSVVPYVDLCCEGDTTNVGAPAMHRRGQGPQARTQQTQCSRRNVDRLDRAITTGRQIEHQCRSASADYSDPVRGHRHAAHEFASGLGAGLEPADLVKLFRRPHGFPMVELGCHVVDSSESMPRRAPPLAKQTRNS